MVLYNVKTWIHNLGTPVIQEHVPTLVRDAGDRPLPNRYFSSGVIPYQIHDDKGNTMPAQHPFTFEIPADSIEEAFELHAIEFDGAKERAKQQLKQQFEAQKRQLLLPNGQRLPPPGKPKTRLAG